jgi:hypothetical protein
LAELLDDQVVNLLVELHYVVPLELVVHMSEGDLRVLRADLDLYGILIREELELLECTFKMLDLSED